jgi:hypothetical protein
MLERQSFGFKDVYGITNNNIMIIIIISIILNLCAESEPRELNGYSDGPIPVKVMTCSSSSVPDQLYSPPSLQPALQWVPKAISPGVMRSERQAYLLPPKNVECLCIRVYVGAYAFWLTRYLAVCVSLLRL